LSRSLTNSEPDFFNLVSEALLTDFSVSTVTTTFENDFQVDAWELVKHRYDQWEVSEPYEDLQEHAYDLRKDHPRGPAIKERIDKYSLITQYGDPYSHWWLSALGSCYT
jgi:hypothetical protein